MWLWPPTDVKGGEKVYRCGEAKVFHWHDEKELDWEPGGVRSGEGVASSGVRQESSRSSEIGEAAFSPAVPETVAVVVHLQDVDVIGEPVQQDSGH